MTYTEVFGGNTIYPSDVSYLAIALTGDIDLNWPVESAAPPYPLARIIDVIANGPHTMRLPDATMAAPGEVTLFNVLTASSDTCFLVDHDGINVGVLAPGEQWEVYLTDNTTAAGEWEIFHFGASTASVQPSALAGYGIVVTGSTLSQSAPVTTFDASPRTAAAHDRASALVWTGSGSGVLTLPGVAAVGNNFFVSARNAGGGMLTLDPLGTEQIDGGPSVSLAPGEGVVLVTDGIVWYTLGRGQAAVFAFDYTVIDVAPGGTYTLSGSELNRISYKFTGALTTDVIIVVPATVQQYWVDNATTGPFGLSLSTAGGIPVAIAQGSRGIFYCDGTNVLDAETGGLSTPINASDGGTGHSSYNIGDLLAASSPATLARLAIGTPDQAMIVSGTPPMPFWGKINMATMVAGVLPPANGGTGSSSASFTYQWHLKGGPAGQIVSSTLVYDDGTSLVVGGSIVAPVLRLSNSAPSTYIGLDGGVNPIFNFDANDFIRYFPATDTMEFAIAGSDRLVINSGGVTSPLNFYQGDTNHFLAVNSGHVQHGFDPSDYMDFDRATNIWNLIVGGVSRVNISPTVINIGGPLVNLGAEVRATQFTLLGPPQAYWATSGPNPVLNFDANDYILHDLASNVMTLSVGGGRFVVDAVGVKTTSGSNMRWNDDQFFAQLQGANALTGYDANDYMYYDRTNNQYVWAIGGTARLVVSSTATSVFNDFTANTLWSNDSISAQGWIYCKPNTKGGVVLQGGDPAYSGVLGFLNAAGGRIGFIGSEATATGIIQYNTEVSGGYHLFNSNVQAPVHMVDTNAYFNVNTAANHVIFNYDANDWFRYIRASNACEWIIGGASMLSFDPTSMNVNLPIWGTQTIIAKQGGSGGCGVAPGNSTNTGLLAFYNTVAARIGYIGFMGIGASGNILYTNEQGGGHAFNGSVVAGVNLTAGASITGGGTMYPNAAAGSTYFTANDTNLPLINWDANDYIQYNRASNVLNTSVGGSLTHIESATQLAIIKPVRLNIANAISDEVISLYSNTGMVAFFLQSNPSSGAICYLQHQGSAAANNVFVFTNASGGVAGSLYYVSGGAGIAIGYSSDERLKENIVDASSPGAIIDAIRVRAFDWREGPHDGYGLVAQELHAVFPDAVRVGSDKLTEFRAAVPPTPEIPAVPPTVEVPAVFADDGTLVSPMIPADPGSAAIPASDGLPEQRGGDLADPWQIDYARMIPLLIKEIQDLRGRLAAAGL